MHVILAISTVFTLSVPIQRGNIFIDYAIRIALKLLVLNKNSFKYYEINRGDK
jgi:hypothetical protein